MIKYNTNESNVEINGTVIDIAAEATFIIRQIYKLIREENIEAAERFKKMICNSIESCFWSDEEIRERTKEMEERIEKISKFFDLLKDKMSDPDKNEKPEDNSEDKDIRKADFDSEKAFDEWLHGF